MVALFLWAWKLLSWLQHTERDTVCLLAQISCQGLCVLLNLGSLAFLCLHSRYKARYGPNRSSPTRQGLIISMNDTDYLMRHAVCLELAEVRGPAFLCLCFPVSGRLLGH